MSTITELHHAAQDAAARSRVPYSGIQRGCALLLDDGMVIPGARVESASFSLVIPPLVNGFSTAAALNRTDIAAVATDASMTREDVAFLAETFAGGFAPVADNLAIRRNVSDLPEISGVLSPFIEVEDTSDENRMILEVRRVAERAIVPESAFPVGCLLMLKDGRLIPGVNVEHIDWSRVLCAERNALGTMISYGYAAPTTLYLTCPCDASCSPCGACRQLLAELAPEATLCMDRAERPVERATPNDLLPGFFAGDRIPGRAAS